jgi:multidrug resistance efflux pump
LLVYGACLGGPYLHSIFVRDAAVTTWLHVATAPVPGELAARGLRPGETVGDDRRVATIVNPLADRTALARAEADFAAATARATQFERIAAARRARRAAYATAFERELDQRAATAEANLSFITRRLETERAEAGRAEQLRRAGSASAAAAEAATARVAALEAERATIDGELKRVRLRRANTTQGVYLAEDGQEPEWSARHDPLTLERETLEVEQATSAARTVVAAARDDYEHRHGAALEAPPGAVIWNRPAAPGAHVESGAPVLSWIDPTVVLVDAPVSDLEIALLPPGTRARVKIEGESRPREGVVLLTRSSSAPLDVRELAATARGRRPGTAQVIIRLDPTPDEPGPATIGRPAYVTFPGVSVFRLLQARLHW